MSLEKLHSLGNGLFKWKIRLRLPPPPGSEKPVQIHRHIEATPEAAREIYAELGNQKSRARSGLKHEFNLGDNSIGKRVSAHIKHLQTLGKNPRHIEDVERHLALLISVTSEQMPVDHVTKDHIIEFQRLRSEQHYRGKPPTATTINKARAELSAFFSWCGVPNPVAVVKKVKQVAPQLRLLLWSEYCRFADAAWQRPLFGLFIEVLAETGARVDEVMRARVGDVDTARKLWHKIVKPGRRVEMDAEPWVLFASKDRPKADYLCPREDGKPWTYSMIQKAFDRYCVESGIKDITPHYFRHGRACWDLAEGKSVWDVQMKLGHTSVTTTEKYLRAAQTLKRAEPGVIHARDVSKTLAHLCPKLPVKCVFERLIAASCGYVANLRLTNIQPRVKMEDDGSKQLSKG